MKEKLNQNQNRISSLDGKITNYAAIILAYIGFVGYILTELVKIENHNSYFYIVFLIMFFIVVVYTFNLIIFIHRGLSVKTYVRSTFSDLKNTPTSEQLATSYYLDWYSSKNQADIMSPVVCYIEEYHIKSLCASFLLWIVVFLINNGILYKIQAPPTVVYENEKLVESKVNDFLINFPSISSENHEINSAEFKSYRVCSKTGEKGKLKIQTRIIDNRTILLRCKG